MLVARIEDQSDGTTILIVEGGPPVGAQMEFDGLKFPSNEEAARYARTHNIWLEMA